MKYLFIILFFNVSFALFSSNGEGPIGARSAALGHASSCFNDVWSARNNQGSLGFVRRSEVGVFSENRFLVKELIQSGFAAVAPIKIGTFGLSYSSIGYKLYRESHVSVGYGMKLSEVVSAGVSLDYLNTRIGDVYGQANAFTGSIGLTARLTNNIAISSHIYNPFRAKITSYNNEKIPTILKFGAQYIFSKQVFMVLEAEKTSFQKVNLKGGIEYKPTSIVFIRVGGSSFPSQASFGVGVNYNGLKIDISSMYHSVLGISPQIGLSYGFGKLKGRVSSKSLFES